MNRNPSGATRRQFLMTTAVAALAAPAIVGISTRASAAQHVLKFGHDLSVTHPAHTNLVAASKKIEEDSKGQLRVQVFPNGQLGGDTEELAQVRSGALDMTLGVPSWLASSIPQCAASDLGFTFSGYDQCWAAWDGDFGDRIRSLIAGAGITTFDKTWDLGFRQVTSNAGPVNSVDDLKGLKIRLPGNPVSTAMFKALGASPVTIELTELYTALQTHLVDAEENSLVSINAANLQEVQKYCSITNHLWNGLWIFANTGNLNKLPEDLRKILFDRMNEAGLNQRKEMADLAQSLVEKLQKDGMVFNTPSQESFKNKLRDAGFYVEWKAKIGDDTWALLEKYTGKIG
jgi:tripartite ATP-independent transporter DctP family solute receptor